jgi:hypothetical protein
MADVASLRVQLDALVKAGAHEQVVEILLALVEKQQTAGREFSAGGLRHWAYRLKKRGLPAAETETKQSTTVRVARVERIAAPTAALVIEVGPARLLVPSGADAETLKATIAALVEATRAEGRA